MLSCIVTRRGRGQSAPGAQEPFFWEAQHGLRSLSSVLTAEYGLKAGGLDEHLGERDEHGWPNEGRRWCRFWGTSEAWHAYPVSTGYAG